MIHTLQTASIALSFGNQHRPVATDIVKRPQAVILTTGDDQRLSNNLTDEKVANPCHHIGATNRVPCLPKDPFFFQF